MFRLVDNAFQSAPELHTLAVYCLTETIKSHVAHYFVEGYGTECEQPLYTKVNPTKALSLFPADMLDGMVNLAVDVPSFIPKKIAQLMLLLNNQDEITPDLFLEYILYRMIVAQRNKRFDFMPKEVIDNKEQLVKLLRTYAKTELDIIDTKERNAWVKNNTVLLTGFTGLLGDDDSLAFWDLDCTFFDDWGFEQTLSSSAFGILKLRGYGLEYTRSIFTDVGQDVPYILLT